MNFKRPKSFCITEVDNEICYRLPLKDNSVGVRRMSIAYYSAVRWVFRDMTYVSTSRGFFGPTKFRRYDQSNAFYHYLPGGQLTITSLYKRIDEIHNVAEIIFNYLPRNVKDKSLVIGVEEVKRILCL